MHVFFQFALLFTAYLSTWIQPVRSSGICYENQIEALFAKNLSEPWLHQIASSAEYDNDDWMDWNNVNQTAAYTVFSRYLTLEAFNVAHDSIREHYAAFGSKKLTQAQSHLNFRATFDRTTDQQSWDTVYHKLYEEMTKVLDLFDWKDAVWYYLDSMSAQQTSVVSEVSGYIQENTAHSLYVGSTSSSAWSAANEVFNSFAGLFGIFGDGAINDAIQLTSWAVTTAQSLGDAVISNQNSGTTWPSGISYNNWVLSKTSTLKEDIAAVYTTAKTQVGSDTDTISRSGGKISKFWECYHMIGLTESNASEPMKDAILSTTTRIKPYQTIMAWKLLLPAKYKFQAQFSCSDYITTDTSKCRCPDKLGPTCEYTKVDESAKSTQLHINGAHGYIVGFLGDNAAHDGVIVADTVTQFNDALKGYLGSDDWTLHSILDKTMQNVHDFTEMLPTKFPDSVTVSVNSALQFTFESVLNGWCMYECHPWSDGDNDAFDGCKSTRSTWDLGCKYCTDHNTDGRYDQYCPSSHSSGGSSCLSSTTEVLMADDSYKPITDIVIGDSVKNPLTGTAQTVQAISTPLRNRRKLYSVNALDFKFTRAHPFILQNGTISAMDKDALLFYIPTLNENRVEYMNVSDSLAVFASNSISDSLSIQNIGEFYFDESADSVNEILYDLVFDLTSPSMYVVNGGIVVSNEWYDFQAYPKSAYVILGILSALVQSEDHTLHRLSTNLEKNGTVSNQIMASVARHTMPFNGIISSHARDVLNNVNESDIGEVCEAFTLDESEGTNGVTALYESDLWAIRKAMEEFVARITPQLNTILHSESSYSDVCFDDVDYALLIQDLVTDMKDLMLGLEFYLEPDEEISTTEIIAETEAITTEPQDDGGRTFACFVCWYVVVLRGLFG